MPATRGPTVPQFARRLAIETPEHVVLEIELAGPGSRGAELEAQVRARAGDAGGAIAALRPLAQEGRLDRSVLRADPAYLPIATDPAWVIFLNERLKE